MRILGSSVTWRPVDRRGHSDRLVPLYAVDERSPHHCIALSWLGSVGSRLTGQWLRWDAFRLALLIPLSGWTCRRRPGQGLRALHR